MKLAAILDYFFSFSHYIYHIYQPLRTGMIWYKVNFLSGV